MAELRRATELLADLVDRESPSGDTPRLEALAGRVAELLRAAGATAEVLPGGHLLARYADRPGPHVLVLGHLDTVWPVGRLAQAPFTVLGDQATGPGVFDMKGALVSLLFALEDLGRRDEVPPYPIRVLLTADEEVGSPEGGVIVAEQARDALAVLALEPPLPEGRLKVGRRGVARIRLEVTGRAAHAGLDRASGISATEELVDQLSRLAARVPATDACSINVGTLDGGTRANVVAASAHAELGLRFADAASERSLFAEFDQLRPVRTGAKVSYRVLSHRPAWEPSGSARLSEHVRRIAAGLGEVVDAGVSPGAGDANLTGGRGIPTVDGLGPRGHGAHAPDETVQLPSILVRARLLAEILGSELPAPIGENG